MRNGKAMHATTVESSLSVVLMGDHWAGTWHMCLHVARTSSHLWLVGGHLLEDDALLLLKWQLGGAVLAALLAELVADEADRGSSTASPAAAATESAMHAAAGVAGSSVAEQQQHEKQHLGNHLSEKGVLQLLFDVRFLLDLLAGGRPPRWAKGCTLGGTEAAAVLMAAALALPCPCMHCM